MCIGMSGLEPDEQRHRRYRCEFARDCMTQDGVHCPINPDECEIFIKKALVEGEISSEEANRRLAELKRR